MQNFYHVNGEQFELNDVIDSSDIWQTKGGEKVINLSGFQKIADKHGIVEKKIETVCLPSEENKMSHIVNIWIGLKGDNDPDNWERGSGEASRFNTGEMNTVTDANGNKVHKYKEIGVIDACNRYSIAEKRAYVRAMRRFLGLYKMYAAIEAQAFYNPEEVKKTLDY